MRLTQLHSRTKELDTPKGRILTGLHLATWDSIKGLPFSDQMWILNGLTFSIKKRQEMHYCAKCRSTNCKHKES
jgi:hypothetical protein